MNNNYINISLSVQKFRNTIERGNVECIISTLERQFGISSSYNM